MDLNTFLILIFLLGLLFFLFLVPLLIRAIRLVGSIRGFIDSVNDSIKPLLEELTETTERINNIVKTLEESAGHIKEATEPIGEIGDEIGKLRETLKTTENYIKAVRGQTVALIIAVSTTIKELKKQILRGGQNG